MKNRVIYSIIALSSIFAVTACSSDDNGETPKAVEKSNVFGNIEKGPFVQGSKVTLYELEVNLSQTGKSFKTQTSSDLGAFAFDSPIQLNSQFVELETSGYFYNEVKGELSTSQITLNALSNVANRNSVNVNLITHLEYGRVKKLVREGTDFTSAKKQAEKELLSCFAITDEISVPEGVSITDNNKNSSILLAISTIMLYDRSEAEFTEFISKFSTDFADNGLIDNATIRENIKKGQADAHPSKVIERMKEFYSNKGVDIQCDDFSRYIDFNGDGVINEEDEEDKEGMNEEPNVVVAEEDFFNTKGDVYAVLYGCYAGLQQYINYQLQLEYIRTQRLSESAPWWNPTLISSQITANSPLVSAAYTNAYKTINLVNMLLEHKNSILRRIPDFYPASEGEAIFAQAEIIRAFAYYNLTVLWGGVPLVTKSYTVDDIMNGTVNIVQSNPNDILVFAKEEIEKALNYLPDYFEAVTNNTKNKCYFTRDAARILLAEVAFTLEMKNVGFTALSNVNSSEYDASITDASAIYDGNIDDAQSVIFALALEGHYQPVYTRRHYDLLLKEFQGETESIASEWKESLCTEYGYWAALKRLGIAQSVTGCKDYELLMPFPSSEMAANPNLRQNPGY